MFLNRNSSCRELSTDCRRSYPFPEKPDSSWLGEETRFRLVPMHWDWPLCDNRGVGSNHVTDTCGDSVGVGGLIVVVAGGGAGGGGSSVGGIDDGSGGMWTLGEHGKNMRWIASCYPCERTEGFLLLPRETGERAGPTVFLSGNASSITHRVRKLAPAACTCANYLQPVSRKLLWATFTRRLCFSVPRDGQICRVAAFNFKRWRDTKPASVVNARQRHVRLVSSYTTDESFQLAGKFENS